MKRSHDVKRDRHRAVFQFFYGKIPDDWRVYRSCSCPAGCQEPTHMYQGKPKGSTLKPEERADMCKLHAERRYPDKRLARMYGLTVREVRSVVYCEKRLNRPFTREDRDQIKQLYYNKTAGLKAMAYQYGLTIPEVRSIVCPPNQKKIK